MSSTFNLSHETKTRTIAEYLSYQVKVVYESLTGNFVGVQIIPSEGGSQLQGFFLLLFFAQVIFTVMPYVHCPYFSALTIE